VGSCSFMLAGCVVVAWCFSRCICAAGEASVGVSAPDV
jgi:hypothetical protein